MDLAFGGMWYAIVAAEQVTDKPGNPYFEGGSETGATKWKENCQVGRNDQGRATLVRVCLRHIQMLIVNEAETKVLLR